MTVSTSTRVIRHPGNSFSDVFPFNFRIDEAEHVHVILEEIATGNRTELAQTEYTITGLGSANGGSIQYPVSGSPILDTHALIIYREVPLTQDLDITNQSGFFPNTVEQQLDHTTFQIQQVNEEVSRAVRVPIGEESIPFPPAAVRAGKVFGFDHDGKPDAIALTFIPGSNAETVAGETPGDVGLELLSAETFGQARAAIETPPYAIDRAAIKALDPDLDFAVFLVERGREGLFTWVEEDLSTLVAADPLEGVYIESDEVDASEGAWVRLLAERLNVKWFGAKGDGVNDDSPPANAAVALAAAQGGGVIYFPGSALPYIMASRPNNGARNAAIYITSSNIYLEGDGFTRSIIKKAVGLAGIVVTWVGTEAAILNGGGLRDLQIDGIGENGHGVRIESIRRWKMERNWIRNSGMYGLGGQGGTLQYIDILNNIFENTGGDGIDIKNIEDTNICIVIRGNTVTGHGASAEFTNQAGIDARGEGCIISDNTIRAFGTNASGRVGIRAREGDAATSNGIGAIEAQIDNNRVICNYNNDTVGILAANSRCQIHDNHVTGAQKGIEAWQTETMISDNFVRDCGVGIQASVTGFAIPSNGDRVKIEGNIIRGRQAPNEDGIVIQGIECLVNDNIIRSKAIAIRIDAGAANTIIDGNQASNNTSGLIDAGTGTVLGINRGL